jgi:hypothetical protein
LVGHGSRLLRLAADADSFIFADLGACFAGGEYAIEDSPHTG